MLINCLNCKDEINVPPSRFKEGKGKYCSRECRYETELKPNHVCKICDKEFHVSPSSLKKGWDNFCSIICWKKSRPKIETFCKNCNISMIISKARFKDKRGIFCSKQCQYLSMEKKVKIICEVCNNDFFLRPSESKNRKFCSEKCMGISKTTLVIKQCKICKKDFKIKFSRILQGKGKTCSQSCAGLYKTKCSIDNFFKRVNFDFNQIKGKSILDQNWSIHIKSRDKICQICGKKVKDAHHILYRQFYPLLRFNENNGIGLCELCHYQSHGKKLIYKVI